VTRYALTLEYDGTPFMGLQRQPHGPSVQQAVEEAAHALCGEDVCMAAAGRTDTGVHAIAMRAHVDIARPFDAFRLMEGLNAKLRPWPVAVIACEEVPDDWHARFSCTGREYVYRILNRRARPALLENRVWHEPRPLNEAAMHRAAQALVGRHDFTTFRSAHCQARDPVKTLDVLSVERAGDEVRVVAKARSFLHHQVRSMTGCLALVGLGKWRLEKLGEVLAARDRQQLGFNAPPGGLYFVAAHYDGER
jgi:tRNA pseudouridine38-40 synthase